MGTIEKDAGGFSMRVVRTLLPGSPSPPPATELDGWLRDRKLGLRVVLATADCVPSPTEGRAYQAVADVFSLDAEHAPVGPYILSGQYTSSSGIRARGLRAYGVSPFAVNFYDALTIHHANERISLPFFVEGIERMRRDPSRVRDRALSGPAATLRTPGAAGTLLASSRHPVPARPGISFRSIDESLVCFSRGPGARGPSGGRAAAGADDAGRTHARSDCARHRRDRPGSPQPLPCPGMAGLEVGQTRTFSFERMALHEPAKKTVTRDLKVVHTPEGRPWTVDVTYASDALDAKVVALHYLLDPPSGLYEGILERYGKGTPVASEPGVSSWDVPFCVGATTGVRLRYRMGMSDKQRRVEELWVEPLTAKSTTAKKR